MVNDLKGWGIPTVAYHLDLWHGLEREQQLREEPYFRCDHFFSTDGGDHPWPELGINHHWLPPAVYHAEAYDGTPRDEYRADIAFVGSHRSYGHKEHEPVRLEMLRRLHRRYRRRLKLFPMGKAVRGTDLTDLYASVKVVIGDSCLAGKIPGYWSDRVPETMGRGGFLIHPDVERITEQHPYLVTYEPGNWEQLIEWIDYYLAHDGNREAARAAQAEDTRERHTYQQRMQTVLEVTGLA